MARPETSQRLDWAVHISLLGGLLLSASLLVLGAARVLASHQPHAETRPEGAVIIFTKAARGDGVAILDLGVLILMLTPVLRVVVLAVGWLASREWRFGLIALTVLALLVTSILLGTG